jgi:RimJ/RimL family protein N-acetyltransferase
MTHLVNPAVLQYVTTPPGSIEAFRRFIRWSQARRRASQHLTYGVVPAGQREAGGLMQIWPIEPDFSTAEWGFVLGESLWGKGIFSAAAELLLEFAFQTLSVVRLEARVVDADERANHVLRKLGATREGTLRAGFRSRGTVMNHVMWSILADEWNRQSDLRQRVA